MAAVDFLSKQENVDADRIGIIGICGWGGIALNAAAAASFTTSMKSALPIHHKQVQVLICVAGRGWYQEWGKEPIPMTPGTVIAVPAEVKHWHGAQKDSWFQHLTYHKDVQEGASNEWLEASPQIVH